MLPVAPPRLLPQLGFVDTAVTYGQSVFGPNGISIAPQLAAMPSVHVAWAVLIAAAVIMTSSSRWRWLILLHPLLTLLAVVATGNHWWLDGLVGAALLAPAVVIERAATTAAARWRDRAGQAVVTPAYRLNSAISGPAMAAAKRKAPAE